MPPIKLPLPPGHVVVFDLIERRVYVSATFKSTAAGSA